MGSGRTMAVPWIAAGPRWLSEPQPPTQPEPDPAAGVVLVDAGGPPSNLGFPVVGGAEQQWLRDGEWVGVDGSRGLLELESVQGVPVVTVFLQREDDTILLLRRSEQVSSYRGRWAAVSGFLEERDPMVRARIEVTEETGLSEVETELDASAPPLYIRDEERMFVVHPFRFRVRSDRIRLDWEHSEGRWVRPEEMARYETVPQLERVWRAVASGAVHQKR
ncbi:MAG: NUDIX domain-containing protein [Thermoplasmata archaeon]|nr:NUDIX domain-containing protein [Thermoplasmata archaeon]MCI4337683.1 NUDIX domain-containing protein [Thermoplasmata archaeon]MCI4341326.1 NUDIX domain-containing protein [Thermoplasmata archaeon]